ncbi:heme-binding domain-containing protein [uncultured Dokdonia sp.]|uniref:heme-binding domain-containing protein n=1 Tax=uncultured Dokdonia sp. TaxID=575653 RepID=UPI00263972BD|nr:heme-binding domain-containing protein [uncultured Dokdonia sp.]
MKWIKRLLVLALLVLVVMQFIRPDKNQEGGYDSVQPFLAETKPIASVEATLKETCFDCHSNQTRYPWYAEVAPVSYWLEDHIKDGKKHLNFSEWSAYSVKRKDHKLEEVIEMVEDKEMPLDSYTWTHEEAQLSDVQIREIVNWAKVARFQYSLNKVE